MSRSYKKTPSSGGNYRDNKRKANRKVRRYLKDDEIILHGKKYRRVYDSWDIKDYHEVAESFESFYHDQLMRYYMPRWFERMYKDRPPTKEECWNIYQRWYLRK